MSHSTHTRSAGAGRHRHRAVLIGLSATAGLFLCAAGCTAPRVSAPMSNTAPDTAFVQLAGPVRLGPGEKLVGPLPATARVSIRVALKMRDKAQLDAAIAHGQTISHAELAAHYLPAAAAADAIVSYLQRCGFTEVKVLPGNTLIAASGDAAAVYAAFHTTLVQVQTPDGRAAYANNAPVEIPARFKDTITAVIGLQSVHRAHILAKPKH